MFNIKSLPDSRVEIAAEVPADEFNLFFHEALLHAQRDLELPGFRKGMVPEKTVLEHVGQEHIMVAAAERAIAKHWPQIIKEADIEPIGRPEVSITKIAKDNPLGFKLTVSVLQKFTLPDYKAIAHDIAQKPLIVDVTDEEVQKAFEYVKQNNKELPADTDDAKLKSSIHENFKFEKEHKAKENRRVEMLEAIAKKTEIVLPTVVVDAEIQKMINELKNSLTQMGLAWDEYIAHIKKSEDELKKEWHDQAATRAKIGIIMREIARAEKLIPSAGTVKQKVEEVLRSLSQEERREASPEAAEDYVYGRLQHEMVFDLLEKIENLR